MSKLAGLISKLGLKSLGKEAGEKVPDFAKFVTSDVSEALDSRALQRLQRQLDPTASSDDALRGFYSFRDASEDLRDALGKSPIEAKQIEKEVRRNLAASGFNKDEIDFIFESYKRYDVELSKLVDSDALVPANEGGPIGLLADEMSRMGYSNGNKVSKPDFLDLDGDGDKEEPMKEAAKDRKEMRVGGDPMAELRAMYEDGGESKMLPDEKMEEQFVDFVIDEALSEQEESMLMEQLEANPELSMIFDKVIEKASEFTGAGEVEGPGTGTSDSIPARLSDGEFVFTAKAVKQLGVDNLNKMMDDAEAAFDAGEDRKAMQEGGLQNMSMDMQEDRPDNTKKVEMTYNVNKPESVSTVNPLLARDEEEDLINQEIKKGMLGRPNMRS